MNVNCTESGAIVRRALNENFVHSIESRGRSDARRRCEFSGSCKCVATLFAERHCSQWKWSVSVRFRRSSTRATAWRNCADRWRATILRRKRNRSHDESIHISLEDPKNPQIVFPDDRFFSTDDRLLFERLRWTPVKHSGRIETERFRRMMDDRSRWTEDERWARRRSERQLTWCCCSPIEVATFLVLNRWSIDRSRSTRRKTYVVYWHWKHLSEWRKRALMEKETADCRLPSMR